MNKHFYRAGKTARKAMKNFPSFISGMLSTRAPEEENPKNKKGRKRKIELTGRIAEAAIEAGKTAAEALANRPGLQVSLESLKMKFRTGKAEADEVISEIDKAAGRIIALLRAQGGHFQRLAVDGVPGSGKSTLAKSLAKKLKFEAKTLDNIDLNKPQDFSQAQAVYEHHRLLRTQDIDNFDAIAYIDEPVELSKAKCLHRKRDGFAVDIFDYQKLKRIGKEAFDIADGRAYAIENSYIKVKIKPEAGFKALENIRDMVNKQGIKTEGFSKEQLLFLFVYGQAKQGIMAYVNFGAYNKELLKGLNAGILKFLTA